MTTSSDAPVRLSGGPGKSGIALHGWAITTGKAAICNAGELEQASAILPVPTPEMLFGNNFLDITHESGLHITFRAVDALKRVDASPESAEGIKVACAAHWAKNNPDAHKIKDVVKPYDWTYSTDYTGTVVSSPQRPFEPTTTHGVDVERLKRPDPILFYDEVVLFEDELGDNGTALLTLRVRVMPSCFLVLQRFFLRVDDVLFRINDTRVYHEFGTSHLVREYSSREEEYATIREKLPSQQPAWHIRPTSTATPPAEDLSPLTDPNWVAATMAATGPPAPTHTLRSVEELRPAPPAPGRFLVVREAVEISMKSAGAS